MVQYGEMQSDINKVHHIMCLFKWAKTLMVDKLFVSLHCTPDTPKKRVD